MVLDRLVEAIHYTCTKASGDPTKLTQIKLNKVLWYADSYAYLQYGAPITGDTYLRKPFGPVARFNRRAIQRLEQEGALRRGKAPAADGFWNTHFDVIDDTRPGALLSDQEFEILDHVFDAVVKGHTSMSVSDRTHGEIWELAAPDEVLPLYTVYAEQVGVPSETHMRMASEGL